MARPWLPAALIAGLVSAPASSVAQPVTIQPERGGHLREVRCNEDAQTALPQRLHLTREQCLRIASLVGVLPEEVPESQRQATFEAMDANTAIGRPAPDGITLVPLPQQVVADHPDLARFLHFVTGTDIAIVEPGIRVVVALINVRVRPPYQGDIPRSPLHR